MSDTPKTDAAECRLRYYETRCGDRYEETLTYIEPEYARDLERELAVVTAERDRMRPVVEAAQNFRRPTKTFFTLLDALNDAVDTYEAATCPSATAMP